MCTALHTARHKQENRDSGEFTARIKHREKGKWLTMNELALISRHNWATISQTSNNNK